MNIPYIDFYTPGMGTIAFAKFASSIIDLERPRVVLEIGCGYSSYIIYRALQDSEIYINDGTLSEDALDNLPETIEYYIVDESLQIDSEQFNRSNLIQTHFIKSRFQTGIDSIEKAHENFDLVIFDCGGKIDYENWCERYLERTNLSIFHFTSSRGVLNSLGNTVEGYGRELGYEVFHFYEPHKKRQAGCTVIRRPR